MPSTTYLNNQVLTATVNGGTVSVAQAYFALFSTLPTAAGGGTELSGLGYSRQAITLSVSGSVATNSTDTVNGPATGNWDTAVGWGILDAATGGNVLYYDSFASSQTVLSGDTLTIDAGNLSITMA